MSQIRFDGKVVIVTGAGAGIGRKYALFFASRGAKVVVNDLGGSVQGQGASSKAADTVVQEIKAAGGTAVANYDSVEFGDKIVKTAMDAFGRVDILINNAGIVHQADFLDLKEEDFDRVMRVNLKGAFLCGQAVAKRMVERVESGGDPGTIINMSSINAIFGLPEQLAYSVSKGGLNQLTRTMAVALAHWGIRVNAIGPGSIETDMLSAVNTDADARNTILSRTPLGRIGQASEIASIASFLASRDASYVTGQTIYADGGRLPLSYTAAPRFKA